MTLELYSPDRLDQLALRVADILCCVRKMADRARQEAVPDFPLHDKKALEWIAKLEHWAHKAEAEVEMRIIKQRGARRALELSGGEP